MFIDEVRIHIIAGAGGDGCVAFRREKFVPRGGPSGGDGGRGGDIYMESNPHMNTLVHLRYTSRLRAPRGQHGEGSNRHGRAGKEINIQVPVGTVGYDLLTGERLHDFQSPGQRYLAAAGGRGGHGNARFATSTRQAPQFATPGKLGQEVELRLELKLLADVGLVGFPNAGKSTLISRLSAARPKIADYPFTTLEPHLGVVTLDIDRSFIIADIPGILEGAHKGHGLGIRFLKHLERTRLLLHLIDVSEPTEEDPVIRYKVVFKELGHFSPQMRQKAMIVVASKIDAASGSNRLDSLRRFCRQTHKPLLEISAHTGQGLAQLNQAVWEKLQQLSSVVSKDEADSPGGLSYEGRNQQKRMASTKH